MIGFILESLNSIFNNLLVKLKLHGIGESFLDQNNSYRSQKPSNDSRLYVRLDNCRFSLELVKFLNFDFSLPIHASNLLAEIVSIFLSGQ